MPTFSLIIPVYNAEPYLAECLDSCVNQTFKDLEIICINDCSTDSSGKILEKYAEQDNRVKIINHKNNKKQGAARNTGVVAARGDYCWFIDSDDYILLNACEILNDVILAFKTDIIRFNRIDYNYDIFTGKREMLIQESYTWKPNVIYIKKDHERLMMPEVSPCMYITSTVLLKTMKFREGFLYEDNDFTPILFSKADTIYNVNYSLYCVRQRMGSTTKNIDGMSEKHLIDILLAVNALYDYIIAEKLSKKHFCTKTAVILFLYIQQEYNKYPKLHTHELNNEIKQTKVLLKPFINTIHIKNTIFYKIARKIVRLFVKYKL